MPTTPSSLPSDWRAAAIIADPGDEIDRVRRLYQENRDLLGAALTRLGFIVYPSHGTYFLMADHTAFGHADDVAFCRYLTEHVKVAAIPPASFYEHTELGAPLVRFAFCKRRETILEAIARLGAMRR